MLASKGTRANTDADDAASEGRSSPRPARPSQPRANSRMILPERFQNVEEDEDEDDGTGTHDSDNQPFPQRSMYGLLAAAQPRTLYPAHLQQTSDSESEEVEEGSRESARGRHDGSPQSNLQSSPANVSRLLWRNRYEKDRQSRRVAESMFVVPQGRSVRRKPARRASFDEDTMTQSQILPPRKAVAHADPPLVDPKRKAMNDSPVKADARVPQTSMDRSADEEVAEDQSHPPDDADNDLPGVIANIFQFDKPEDVIAEYPCWYLQNVLLQGYMYITTGHICFYAYLQKKSHTAIKTGHLGKRGKRSYNTSYRRYYFVLKGDVFVYYQDASQPYFPQGQVDLRYAVSADVTQEDGSDTAEFTIETPGRTYYYRADSVSAAKDWVKNLQKVIFRSHNEGDSVKIMIPVDNVVSVDRNPMVDFAETVKVRVLDKDDTYAVDDYFFAFFNSAQEALTTLTQLTESSTARDTALDSDEQNAGLRKERRLSSRKKGRREIHERRISSLDDSPGRASSSPHAKSVQESSDSLTTASYTQQSEEEDDDDDSHEIDPNMSASQMLSHDGVFGVPTLRVPPTVGRSNQKHSRPPSQDLSAQGRSGDSRATTGPAETNAKDRPPRILTAPFQHAINVAGIMRSGSKKMTSLLSSSPKVYIDKFSDAYAGGKKVYSDAGQDFNPDDDLTDPDQDSHSEADEQRFREHFALPQSEKLVATYYCWLMGNMPLYGKIYIGTSRFCFRSLLYGTKSKIVIPFRDMVTVQQQRGFRWGYAGIVLVLRGHEELFFDFYKAEARDHFKIFILRKLENPDTVAESTILTGEEKRGAEDAAAENEALRTARKPSLLAGIDSPVLQDALEVRSDMPRFMLGDRDASSTEVPIPPPMRITCLTIGTRGDVQPYIALCKRLRSHGHTPTIATHAEFGDWVKSHGIGFVEVAGDPAELMRICVENGMFTPSFFMEANSKFRSWLDGLLETAWGACQGADLLIESPSAMCGIHIAEALGIPYFRAFTMPWTRTRTYPHAFAVPTNKMGGSYNYMSYTFFDNIFWQAIAGQINRWRVSMLHLDPTNLDRMQQNRVPFLYNFSPNVVIPPLDFSDWIKVTGYWFLDEGKDYTPDPALAEFIARARADGQKLVYIGFGSVTVADSRQLTQQIVDAVLKADVRCILSKGWSDRLSSASAAAAAIASTTTTPAPPPPSDIPLPPCIHSIRAAPHDWLFAQLDAVVIHGGAGTTGAALRAGVPTIIKPFFGDQHFFATRVDDLGVGFHLPRLSAASLAKALWLATRDVRLRDRARRLGERIRAEDGVAVATNAVYAGLEYARGLVEARRAGKRRGVGKAEGKKAGGGGSGAGETGGGARREGLVVEDSDDVEVVQETEENWTFVEVGEEQQRDDGTGDGRGDGRGAEASSQPRVQPWSRPLRLPAVLRGR